MKKAEGDGDSGEDVDGDVMNELGWKIVRKMESSPHLCEEVLFRRSIGNGCELVWSTGWSSVSSWNGRWVW